MRFCTTAPEALAEAMDFGDEQRLAARLAGEGAKFDAFSIALTPYERR